MYLNVNVASSAASGSGSNLLSVEGACTTPKTPEILNSLIAMTNPFDGYSVRNVPRIASCPPGGSDTSSSSAGSPLGSPNCTSPPSVQHTCSQLIKEGLKLTIQTKRRNTGRHLESLDSPHHNKLSKREEVSSQSYDYDDPFSPGARLTAEDEERRRRRRERNKIAATKCRLKKRERTVNLVQESEVLENQNQDLKTQIQELETQRRRLMDMLSMHSPTCMKNSNNLAYSPDTPATYCGDSAAFCTDTTTTTSAGGYQHYSGAYTDNGCMA
ncbi:activating transcription factor 3 isoform X1 [Periplaneta americana]|uniref:activating transcription factor 3 isoform X1 n=1 Tax=Periplaneta americana TaxID=6978 RepID=UPI0037E7C9D1